MRVKKGPTHGERPQLSLIVPLFNEAESLHQLYREIGQVPLGDSYEIIFVDDGSTDDSLRILEEICALDGRVKVVHFARNFGKSEALDAGFRECSGEVVVTLDADLQDDPAEIPILLSALEEGYDLVSGWKVPRRDPFSKTMPSRLFNWMTARLTGLGLHDFNCGLKAYRRELVENLQLYGEQHRFIPALAYGRGFRVGEVRVRHRPRAYGKSKFGAWRFLAGLLDLVTVLFLARFKQKPLHLFGSMGLVCLLVGLIINLYLTYLRLQGETIGSRPLLMLGVLLMVMGLQFLSTGLLGEMLSLSAAQSRDDRRFYQVMAFHQGEESGVGGEGAAKVASKVQGP